MNALILSSSFGWVLAMSIMLCLNNSTTAKIVAFSIISMNIISTIYHFIIDDNKKSLELRVYADNIMILLVIALFPKEFFYGYSIQVLLSILIVPLYLKNKIRVYKILIFLIITETLVYLPLCHLQFSYQLIYNTSVMVLLLSVLIVAKNKLLLDPGRKFKKIVTDTNNIIKHQIIECITPMYYYIRNMEGVNKSKMEGLLNKLKYMAQNNNNNFGYIVSIIKTTLVGISQIKFNVIVIDNTTKPLNIDSYTLLLTMFIMLESSLDNSATEIIVTFNDKKIEIKDNGRGFDIKSKSFSNNKLKTAIDLLDLYEISSKTHSSVGSGTVITLSL